MAITQAMCTSFKVELLNGIHAFGTTVARAGTTADTMKIALFTSSATLGRNYNRVQYVERSIWNRLYRRW